MLLPVKSPISPIFVDLTGPQAIRARFWPRQILSVQDVASVLGLTREAVYKQIRRGQCSLPIHKSGSGLMKVRLDDLISWLYPEQIQAHPIFSSPLGTTDQPQKRKPGRPRKTVIVGNGGMR